MSLTTRGGGLVALPHRGAFEHHFPVAPELRLGPQPGATSSSSEISFTSGGTFSGDVAGEQVSGTWSSIDSDQGTWSGTRDAAATCE